MCKRDITSDFEERKMKKSLLSKVSVLLQREMIDKQVSLRAVLQICRGCQRGRQKEHLLQTKGSSKAFWRKWPSKLSYK